MSHRVLCVAVAALACASLALAQPAVAPLLTQPTEKLTIALGFRDWSVPAVAGNIVVAGNEHSPGGLYAFDAATGKQKWLFRPTPSSLAPVSTATLIAGDRAITGFSGSVIIAVELATGKELWRAPGALQTRAEVVDGAIVVFGKEGEAVVRALDVATGQERWHVAYAEGTGGTGLVGRDGVVYFTAQILAPGARFPESFVLALDAKTGQEQWRYRLEKGATRLYVTSSAVMLTYDNYLYGVKRDTGQELWKVRQLYRTKKDSHGYDKDYLYNIIDIIEADAQVIGLTDEALVGINATTGRYDWEMPGSFHKFSRPLAAAGSVLYFMGNLHPTPPPASVGLPGGDVTLNAMDLTTRTVLWSFRRDKNPDWGLSAVPVDGGLWANAFGALIRLQ